jgi:hypothetical protein
VSAEARKPIPLRQSSKPGIYRRRIVLSAEGDTASGWLEDDFHCFGAKLRHDGDRVVELSGEAKRWPWTTCPGAIDPLQQLVGAPLSTSLRGIARGVDPRAQCTHLFDVALLAIAQAARGEGRRVYDIALPDRVAGHTRSTLRRDGELALAWEIERGEIKSPERYAGRTLQGGRFNAWLDAHFEGDEAEAALVLRRACIIGIGRKYDFDQIPRAEAFAHELGAGACHTFGSSVLPNALRIVGSVRDFTDQPNAMLPKTHDD